MFLVVAHDLVVHVLIRVNSGQAWQKQLVLPLSLRCRHDGCGQDCGNDVQEKVTGSQPMYESHM